MFQSLKTITNVVYGNDGPSKAIYITSCSSDDSTVFHHKQANNKSHDATFVTSLIVIWLVFAAKNEVAIA